MKISSENYEDIKRYYYRTFIKLKETEDIIWLVKDLNPAQVKLVDVHENEVFIDLSEEYEIEYAIPARTVFQRGSAAFCLVRNPAKQYMRGLSKENTMFMRLAGRQFTPMSFDINAVQDFVNKPVYNKLLDVRDDEYDSVALSPNLSISSEGHMFAGLSRVGKISWAKKELHCDPLFKNILVKFLPEGYRVKA